MTQRRYTLLALLCFAHGALTSYYTRVVWDGYSNKAPLFLAILWLGWPIAILCVGARKGLWAGLSLPGFLALLPTLSSLFLGYYYSGMH